jgi:hypothetical protein
MLVLWRDLFHYAGEAVTAVHSDAGELQERRMFAKKMLMWMGAAAAMLIGSQAMATQTVYTTTLSGANEAPPVTSNGIGLGIVTLDNSSFTMRVQTVFFGLTGNTTVAHIHCCTATPGSGTAGVATVTPTFPGFPTGVTQGSYDVTFNMLLASSWNASFVANNGGTFTSAFAALQSGMDAGSAYLNIHSTFAPGGEIRGFLAAPVPEPSTYALMALGLAGVGVAARRRRVATV